jgi:hypothetical protein
MLAVPFLPVRNQEAAGNYLQISGGKEEEKWPTASFETDEWKYTAAADYLRVKAITMPLKSCLSMNNIHIFLVYSIF